MKNVTDADFKSLVLEADKPTLVKFTAEWWGGCKTIAPVVEQVAQELEGKANVFELDVDQAPNTPGEYGIMSIPALLFFKGGQVQARMVGGVKKEKIVEQLKKLM